MGEITDTTQLNFLYLFLAVPNFEVDQAGNCLLDTAAQFVNR